MVLSEYSGIEYCWQWTLGLWHVRPVLRSFESSPRPSAALSQHLMAL